MNSTASSTSTKSRPAAKTAKCALVGGHTAHGACDGQGRPTPKATSPKPVVTRTDADRDASVIDGLATAPSPAKTARAASAARKAAVKATTALPGKATPPAKATPAKTEPKASPKPAKATGEISRKAEMARAMVNALVPVLQGFKPEEQQAAVNMIHHFPTGKTATGARYWPEGILRPDRSDWK